MAGSNKRVRVDFEDFLPLMAEKLGGEELIKELCNGFELLADKERDVITSESLKTKSELLGLKDFQEDEVESMVREGDLDGDGALNRMEFCVLMFRLSPRLMEQSLLLLEDALDFDYSGFGRTGSSQPSVHKKRRRFD